MKKRETISDNVENKIVQSNIIFIYKTSILVKKIQKQSYILFIIRVLFKLKLMKDKYSHNL